MTKTKIALALAALNGTREIKGGRVFTQFEIDLGASDHTDDFEAVSYYGTAYTADGRRCSFALVLNAEKEHAGEWVRFDCPLMCGESAEAEILRSISAEEKAALHLASHQVQIDAIPYCVAIERCFATVIGSTVVFVLPDGKAFALEPADDAEDEDAAEVFYWENVNDESPADSIVFSAEDTARLEAAGKSLLAAGAFELGAHLTDEDAAALAEAEVYCRGKDVAFSGPFYF